MARNDDELFWRAMDTLGAKQQRSKTQPKAKRSDLAAPTVTDDGIDFDALMRGSAGPAKLISGHQKSASTTETTPTETPTEAAEIPFRHVQPAVAPRLAAEKYAAQVSADDLALFAQAMGGAQPKAKDLGGAETRKPSSKPKEPKLTDLLKAREVELDATLDLHGRTRVEALDRTRAFLEESASEGWTFVSIVGGKGVHSPKGQAVLKPFIEGLLRDDFRHFVREYAEAPTYLGGSGTWVVRVNTARRD